MALPEFQSFLLPVLKSFSDGEEHTIGDGVINVTNEFGLMPEDLSQRVPSGRIKTVNSRVSWARTYLTKAGLLEITRHGLRRITERGREVLDKNPEKIDNEFLSQFPEFVEFRTRTGSEDSGEIATLHINEEKSPQEAFEHYHGEIINDLAAELLTRIKECTPEFLEQLSVDLVVKMGYGGSLIRPGRRIGRSGDEGIDGIVMEDKLGLDAIYLQAKRWEGTVGRPQIQAFAGALQGKKANKGIVITTGTFSKEAREYVKTISSKIVLMDGEKLAHLMIEHDLGVSTTDTYKIKKIDTDFFSEE